MKGCKVKQLKSYTIEQLESLFESDENSKFGVKFYAIIQLRRSYRPEFDVRKV
jgi:hypothetical protein